MYLSWHGGAHSVLIVDSPAVCLLYALLGPGVIFNDDKSEALMDSVL